MPTPANDEKKAEPKVCYRLRSASNEPMLAWSDNTFSRITEHVYRNYRRGWTRGQVQAVYASEGDADPIVTEVEEPTALAQSVIHWSDGGRTTYAGLPAGGVSFGDARSLVEERFGKGVHVGGVVHLQCVPPQAAPRKQGRTAQLEALAALAAPSSPADAALRLSLEDALRALNRLRVRTAALEEEVTRLTMRNAALVQDALRLTATVGRQEAVIADQRREVARLEAPPAPGPVEPLEMPDAPHVDPHPRGIRFAPDLPPFARR